MPTLRIRKPLRTRLTPGMRRRRTAKALTQPRLMKRLYYLTWQERLNDTQEANRG